MTPDNPYAPPREAGVVGSDAGIGDSKRVGGWLRVLAAVIDTAAVSAVTNAVAPEAFRAGQQTRTSTIIGVVASMIWITTEIALAASPSMLVLGLRVRRADGSVASRGLLVAKAMAVRAPSVFSVPSTIAIALGLSAAPPIPTTIVPRTALGLVEFLFGAVWMFGYLLAFGARKQTHIDRALDLAVYRARDRE